VEGDALNKSIGRIVFGLLEGAARAAGNYAVERAIGLWEARRSSDARGELPAEICARCGRRLACPACGEVSK
jgi:hypothetical protein